MWDFDDLDTLRALYTAPAHPGDEPPCNFPLGWYERFLLEIRRLDVEVVTFRDLFAGSDDWDYRTHYRREFDRWQRVTRDPRRRALLIQHDVDNLPWFTQRMVAMEMVHGIRSNIFLFHERYSSRSGDPPYPVDHAFFQEAERNGFVIGYHQNALIRTAGGMEEAQRVYRSDLAALRRRYAIDFVVPHGGAGREVDGRACHNHDVPMPDDEEGRLRWVANGYGALFSSRWSDGGMPVVHDPDRLRGLDIVGAFLPGLRPGTRGFCLIHPQRWGFNVDAAANPHLNNEAWYRTMLSDFAGTIAVTGGVQNAHGP